MWTIFGCFPQISYCICCPVHSMYKINEEQESRILEKLNILTFVDSSTDTKNLQKPIKKYTKILINCVWLIYYALLVTGMHYSENRWKANNLIKKSMKLWKPHPFCCTLRSITTLYDSKRGYVPKISETIFVATYLIFVLVQFDTLKYVLPSDTK